MNTLSDAYIMAIKLGCIIFEMNLQRRIIGKDAVMVLGGIRVTVKCITACYSHLHSQTTAHDVNQ